MPYEYEALDVTRFSYRYRRWGENMRIYSHPQICTAMRLISEKGQVDVSEIKVELGKIGIPPSNLSTFLNMLQVHGHVKKNGRVYFFVNNLFFKRIYEATYKLKNYIETKKWKKEKYQDVSKSKLIDVSNKKFLDDRDAASVAKLFSEIIYEDASNYLIHMLLTDDKTFSDIIDVYQTNHAYVSPDRLRYYLTVRQLKLFDKKISIFKQKNKRFTLSKIGGMVHQAFDEALDKYMRDSEIWAETLFDTQFKNLVTDHTAIVHPTDPLFKVLRLVERSGIVLVQTDSIVGIITINNGLNMIAKHSHEPGWWSNVTARMVMDEITENDFVEVNDTFMKIFKKRGSIDKNHYIVRLGSNKYGVIDTREFQQLVNSS